MVRMKRLSAPKFWRIPKKERTWVVSPRPGPHKKLESIPLLILVRDLLKLAETGKDAKNIIKNKGILIDRKPRTDQKYPVGLFDVVSIPKLEKHYRVVPTPEGLDLIEIPKKEASLKLYRINRKTMNKGGKLQLGLHDGRNILVGERKDVYKTGDSLLLELPDQKVVEHVKMEKSMLALITDGPNKGKTARIKEFISRRTREPDKVLCEKDGKDFEVIEDFVFVIGKEKPSIKLSGKE